MTDENNKQPDWKDKFSDLVNTCQSELKKTTQIGMKMLSASQSNTELKETYEKLGLKLKALVEDKSFETENEEILLLLKKASDLEERLKNFEEDVQDIKKG